MAKGKTHHIIGGMNKQELIDYVAELRYVANALREYIDDIPLDIVNTLPAMSGIDCDHVDNVIDNCYVESKYEGFKL